MRVAAVRTRLLLIVPIRFVLGVALLCLTFVGDTAARSLSLSFLVGAVFIAFAALVDRRSLLLRNRDVEPEPLPAGAVHDPNWRVALAAAIPSTLGLAVFSIVALLAGQDVLAALLGGAVAGLGVAAAIGLVPLLAWERKSAVRLYAGPHGRRFVD
jgi:hypothetical protein